MKLRIATWAGLGALVVVVWRVYISATLSNPLGAGGVGRALVHLTCPITIASHPQTFYFVLVMNAATYALAGVIVETARRYLPKPRQAASGKYRGFYRGRSVGIDSHE